MPEISEHDILSFLAEKAHNLEQQIARLHAAIATLTPALPKRRGRKPASDSTTPKKRGRKPKAASA